MSITTILLLLLLVGYSFYTKINKMAAAQKPAMESDSSEEEQDGVFFEDEGALAPENAGEYFTYETEVVKTPARRKTEPKIRPIVVAVEEEPARPQFDLRQAVIAQVILSNNYINEIN